MMVAYPLRVTNGSARKGTERPLSSQIQYRPSPRSAWEDFLAVPIIHTLNNSPENIIEHWIAMKIAFASGTG